MAAIALLITLTRTGAERPFSHQYYDSGQWFVRRLSKAMAVYNDCAERGLYVGLPHRGRDGDQIMLAYRMDSRRPDCYWALRLLAGSSCGGRRKLRPHARRRGPVEDRVRTYPPATPCGKRCQHRLSGFGLASAVSA